MFVDDIHIKLKAGKGGNGKVSFIPRKKAGPDGGNGGNGGDLYFKFSSDLSLLSQFSSNQTIKAENGGNGGSNNMSGKRGEDLEILLPVGSTIINTESAETLELDKVGERILFGKGGRGGRGNFVMRSSVNTTPMVAERGQIGEERSVQILLKLIADFGLIGLPNSGKSSLLNALTGANAKVGDYEFTTLEPSLGVLKGKIIADIPGLIEGASLGRGLGIRFLKHIEKVSILLHCIAADSVDFKKDFQTVNQELKSFNS
ncbi:MAG: Obg family GTPase CgtA, partial [Candidatus Daviesbacteria bacterium]|nr:Obg family GTPase CgtA [Candidatus Daviesbacteria bacterium]